MLEQVLGAESNDICIYMNAQRLQVFSNDKAIVLYVSTGAAVLWKCAPRYVSCIFLLSAPASEFGRRKAVASTFP